MVAGDLQHPLSAPRQRDEDLGEFLVARGFDQRRAGAEIGDLVQAQIAGEILGAEPGDDAADRQVGGGIAGEPADRLGVNTLAGVFQRQRDAALDAADRRGQRERRLAPEPRQGRPERVAIPRRLAQEARVIVGDPSANSSSGVRCGPRAKTVSAPRLRSQAPITAISALKLTPMMSSVTRWSAEAGPTRAAALRRAAEAAPEARARCRDSRTPIPRSAASPRRDRHRRRRCTIRETSDRNRPRRGDSRRRRFRTSRPAARRSRRRGNSFRPTGSARRPRRPEKRPRTTRTISARLNGSTPRRSASAEQAEQDMRQAATAA